MIAIGNLGYFKSKKIFCDTSYSNLKEIDISQVFQIKSMTWHGYHSVRPGSGYGVCDLTYGHKAT